MTSRGLPRALKQYITAFYNNSRTSLEHGGWVSDHIRPTCGVRQDDQLSHTLFNFVIDALLKEVSPDVGVQSSDMGINVLAFADDLVLVASTKQGLQTLLNEASDFLERYEMKINTSRSRTLALITVPKQKKSVANAACTFKMKGVVLPPLNRTDE